MSAGVEYSHWMAVLSVSKFLCLRDRLALRVTFFPPLSGYF
ncbi:hypothetical protein FDUTEX481_06733 [Tolypothrix sp. PCC 7601]|nr:hypothetical protein FDUTEX481_06733 [Tolypothrix sp. PCC 7601]